MFDWVKLGQAAAKKNYGSEKKQEQINDADREQLPFYYE